MSVPVLSVQMTVVQPSVSTDESFLMSAWRSAMRWTPIASDSVTVGSSPSGTSATMMPTEKRKPSIERQAAEEVAEDEEDDSDARGDDRHELRDLAHLLLERAELGLDALRQLGDLAELRLHRRREDDRLAAAVGDRGPREHEVRHLDERQVGVVVRRRGLANRLGLAGERRVVRAKLELLDQPRVRRDRVALFEHHQVAGDELGGRNLDRSCRLG